MDRSGRYVSKKKCIACMPHANFNQRKTWTPTKKQFNTMAVPAAGSLLSYISLRSFSLASGVCLCSSASLSCCRFLGIWRFLSFVTSGHPKVVCLSLLPRPLLNRPRPSFPVLVLIHPQPEAGGRDGHHAVRRAPGGVRLHEVVHVEVPAVLGGLCDANVCTYRVALRQAAHYSYTHPVRSYRRTTSRSRSPSCSRSNARYRCMPVCPGRSDGGM